MKRGEIWTVSGGIDYAAKPRPAVIVQDDGYEALNSVVICLITSDQMPVPLARPQIVPSDENGLNLPSYLMVDKIGAHPKTKFGRHIGQLSNEDIAKLNRAMMVFLGLASTRGS